MAQTPSTGRGTVGDGAAPDDGALSADAADLRASLSALSRLSTGGPGLEDLLVQVATLALQAIPRADGAGLTMIENERSDIVVASAPFVRDVDAIQHEIGEGPCISAVGGGTIAGRRGGPAGPGPAHRGLTTRPRCRTQVGQSRWSFW